MADESERRKRIRTGAAGVPAQQRPHRDTEKTPVQPMTRDRVDDLRREIHAELQGLEKRIEMLGGDVSSLQAANGSIEGKVDLLVSLVQEDRDERRQVRIAEMAANIDVQRIRATSEISVHEIDARARIEDDRDRKAWRRQMMFKVAAAVGAVWAVISALVLAHR